MNNSQSSFTSPFLAVKKHSGEEDGNGKK